MSETTTESDPQPADDLDGLYAALGRPRDPDSLAGHLERSFTMAGRRRVTLTIFAGMLAVGLAGVAVWAVLNDSGLDFGTDEAAFSSTGDSEIFETEAIAGASDAPDLAAADTVPIDRLVAVTAGDGQRIDRVVTSPDPALFPIAPGTVTASLLTFRSGPAVAIVGPDGWYEGTCIQLTPVDRDGEPAAPLWVAAQLGACRAQVAGTPTVPACVGERALVVRLPVEPEIAFDAVEQRAGALSVDVFAPSDGYEELLVTGTVTATVPLTSWPAGLADDGAALTLTGVSPAAGAETASCLVG